jgi:hypothetical protein
VKPGERLFRRITTERASSILLVLVLAMLFVVPAFPKDVHQILYSWIVTLILIFAALSMGTARKVMFIIAVATVALEWISYFLDLPVILSISQTLLFLYFILVAVGLVHQVATTKNVTPKVIVESITGYLLLGIVFSLIITIIARNIPGAYSVAGEVQAAGVADEALNEYIYFGFTNYTTLGYGDIVPLKPFSRAVSTLASVTGQVYLTVIIATLVGKFLSGKSKE